MADLEIKVSVKVKKNEKQYEFICENGSDLGEAYSAYCEIGQWFLERITESEKAKRPKEEPEEEK